MVAGELEIQDKTESSYESLERKLRENFSADILTTGVTHELTRPNNPNQAMGSNYDIRSGVDQQLRAVVRAGETCYFLVDTYVRMKPRLSHAPEYVSGMFISRFRPGYTAQLVDYSVERDFEQATIRPLRSRICIPAIDLSIAMDCDGVVGITDEGSSRQVEVFRQSDIDAEPTESLGGQSEAPSKLVLDGGSAWCIHSSDVVSAINHTLGRY